MIPPVPEEFRSNADSAFVEQEQLLPLHRRSIRKTSHIPCLPRSREARLQAPLSPVGKQHAPLLEASSDQDNLACPLQPTFFLVGPTCAALQPPPADETCALEPSWPLAQVPAASGFKHSAPARTQPSFQEIPGLPCADDGSSTMSSPCHNDTGMAMRDNGISLVFDKEADEEQKCQRRASKTLTQWYGERDASLADVNVSLTCANESLNASLVDVNDSLSCDGDEDTSFCARREAKSLTHWYGDSLSNASTHGALSDIGDSDAGSCITYLAETSDGFSQEYQSRTLLVKNHELSHERTSQAVRSQRPTSIETEVFFLFDSPAIEHIDSASSLL